MGKADECAEMLVNNPKAYILFKAQIAYRRGEITKVYKQARYFLDSHSGFYAILAGGMLLSSVAIWTGDVEMWYEAKHHIFEAPCKSEHEREIISLALAIIDSSIYDNKDYPIWFTSGNFETLPADSHPAAKVFYIKYLYMSAFAIASGEESIEGIRGLSLMKLIPKTIEPLITQAVVDETIIPEIYLRMSCAVAYYNCGEKERAFAHIDKALDLALADRFYGILTEYTRHFGGILEERIAQRDSYAYERVCEMSDLYTKNWFRLSGQIRNRTVVTNLTVKEREVAKLSAFGFTVKEIASALFVSESTVKQTVSRIINKTGIEEKSEFYKFL
jgi:DNA-binding NarL/FixJ family response regulator